MGDSLVRPERLELPAYWFEASRSIQLSYGRTSPLYKLGYTDECMARPSSGHEIEIKLPVAGVAAGKRLLRDLRFSIAKRRALEINVILDTSAGALRRGRKLLRLRQVGNHYTVTFKGPPVAGRHKSREELESEFSDPLPMRRIFERLGYKPAFRYEKYRTEYRVPEAAGVAMLDETPIGIFLELEGKPRWIDRTARALGFSVADYITASYGALYRQYCQANGVKPGDMVFSRSEKAFRSSHHSPTGL
jgi:adenylate cyclase, class 2